MKVFVLESRSIDKCFVFAESEEDIRAAFSGEYKKNVIIGTACTDRENRKLEILSISESSSDALEPDVRKYYEEEILCHLAK